MLAKKLKESTEPLHRESEKKMIAQLGRIESPEDHIRFLNRLYGYYRPLETLIAQHLTEDILPDIHKRKRADDLLLDMLDTGLPLPLPEICPKMPHIHSRASALGALYVQEASTLGGRIIAKMLSHQMGSDRGLSFFSGYGEATAAMWYSFREILQRPYTEKEEREMITAAKETFTTFKNWIQQHELQPQL